jgi:hypothetical protein
VTLSTFYLTSGNVSAAPPFAPSAVTETMNSTFYDVCLAYSSLGATGELCTSYNFGQTPVQIIAEFAPNPGNIPTLGIAWATAGGPYIDAGPSGQAEDAAAATSLTELGNYSSFIMSPTAAIGHSYLSVDYADFGDAPVYYGPFLFGGTAYYAGVVLFHANTFTIDPSVVQTANCYGTSSGSPTCSFSSSVSSGDVVVVTSQGSSSHSSCSGVSITTSQSSGTATIGSFTDENSPCETNGAYPYYTFQGDVAFASVTGGGSLTVEASFNSILQNYYGVNLLEVSGVMVTGATDVTAGGSAGGYCYYSSPCATGSLSFSSGAFIIADVCANDGVNDVGSGFTGISYLYGDGCFGAATDYLAEYATSGVTSPTTFPFYSTYITSHWWTEVGVQLPMATVTQPLTCTVASGGAEGTLTVSGGDVSPTSLTCNGIPEDFTATPSSTLTLTVPSDGANTRYRFVGGTTTATVPTCGSGPCMGASGTVYYQLQNTFDAKPKLPTTWDYTGTGDIAATGTLAGSGSSTICNMSTTSGRTGTVHCAGWSDYDQAVTLGTLTASSTERWVASTNTGSVSPTMGGNNYTGYGHYAKQWQVQWAVSPGGDGSTSPSTTAFYNDTSSVSISASADTGYEFDYWSASSGSITFGSASSPSTTATIGAAGTITASLRQYVQPLNNPSDFVNLTGSQPSVYVSLFNQTDNDLAAGSCSGRPVRLAWGFIHSSLTWYFRNSWSTITPISWMTIWYMTNMTTAGTLRA